MREQLDVVLSDVHLHGMSGIDLCARLSEQNPDLPVILITAFGDRRTALKADAAGAREFIQKPAELQTLCEALTRASSTERPRRVERA
jgi:FixJ family two-component response regulator